MTKILAEPQRPVEDWQKKLDAWIADGQEIINQAKAWAERRGWATRQGNRVITEEIIGTYEAPTLLIHAPQGRLLLEPVARYIVGGQGRFDFCVMPSYDSMALVRTEEGWGFLAPTPNDVNIPWSEESFEKIALKLLKMQ
jgi:hypothetical protein